MCVVGVYICEVLHFVMMYTSICHMCEDASGVGVYRCEVQHFVMLYSNRARSFYARSWSI